MTSEVDDTDQAQAWPPDQWHPVYESVKDWLDNEAPVQQEAKQHNRPRYRLLRRRS